MSLYPDDGAITIAAIIERREARLSDHGCTIMAYVAHLSIAVAIPNRVGIIKHRVGIIKHRVGIIKHRAATIAARQVIVPRLCGATVDINNVLT